MRYKLIARFDTGAEANKLLETLNQEDDCVQAQLIDTETGSVLDGFRDCVKYPFEPQQREEESQVDADRALRQETYSIELSYDNLVLLAGAFGARREELQKLIDNRPDERAAWEADLEKLEALEERIDALLD